MTTKQKKAATWWDELHAQLANAEEHNLKIVRVFLSNSYIEELLSHILCYEKDGSKIESISALYGIPVIASGFEDVVLVETDKKEVKLFLP